MEGSQSYTIIVCDSNKVLEQIIELNIYFLDPNYSSSSISILCYLHNLRQYMLAVTNGIMDPRPLQMSPDSPMQTNGGHPRSKSLGMALVELFQTPALFSMKLCDWSESPSQPCPPPSLWVGRRIRHNTLGNSHLFGK